MIALAAGAVLVAQVNQPQESTAFFMKLAMNRGAVVLVDAPRGWEAALAGDEIRPRLAGVLIHRAKLNDGVSNRLGLVSAGVYFVDRAGRTLKSIHGEAPSDLVALLDSLGWKSEMDLLRRFVRENPARIDARWALLAEARRELAQKQDERTIQQCAEALDFLMRHDAWFQGPSVFYTPIRPREGTPQDNQLSRVAAERFAQAVVAVEGDPAHVGAWSILGFLSAWHSDAPWLYKIVLDTAPLPIGGEFDPEWPGGQILDLCEKQLRDQKNWRGMAEFASRRLSATDAYIASFHPDSLNEWSGLVVASPTKTERPTRRERLGRQAGRWYALAFEASVEEGRIGEAQGLAQRIVQLGEPSSLAKSRSLAARHGLATISAILGAAR